MTRAGSPIPNQNVHIFFEPRTEKERKANRAIAIQIKGFLDKGRGKDPRMSHILLLIEPNDPKLAGGPAGIESYGDGAKDYPEYPEDRLVFPLYVISLNGYRYVFRSSRDQNIYKAHISYSFNADGQGFKKIMIAKDDWLSKVDDQDNEKIHEVDFPPNLTNTPAYLKLENKDYALVKAWMKSVESGKTQTHQHVMKKGNK